MKVAEVYYVGRGRRASRRGPSDERYNFRKTTSEAPDAPTPVHKVEDAIAFEDLAAFEVDWTPMGRLARATDGPSTSAQAALSDMGYRAKQEIAKAVGVKANQKEDKLDEELEGEITQLQSQMEQM